MRKIHDLNINLQILRLKREGWRRNKYLPVFVYFTYSQHVVELKH